MEYLFGRETFYIIIIRHLFHNSECWAIKKYVSRISVVKMTTLKWLSGKIRKDRKRNKLIEDNAKITSITENEIKQLKIV